MTDSLTHTVSIVLPLASFFALFVSVVIFVRYKGTIDALKEAAGTYKSLAEAKDAKIDELEANVTDLKREVAELKELVAAQKGAVALAVDELLTGFVRHGICTNAATCGQFTAEVK